MTTSITRTMMLLAALLLFAGFAGAQETKIKKVPIKPSAADSGDEMYKDYCAVCHGRTGKGDGPALAALKTPPPDLTLLSKKNGGKFPADHVRSVLEMGVEEAAHGTKDMPVWGRLFGSIGGGVASPEVKLRIANLTDHVKSIQTN